MNNQQNEKCVAYHASNAPYDLRIRKTLDPKNRFSQNLQRTLRRVNRITDDHSHSIVAGGLDEMSKHTRLIPFTSLIIRVDTFPSTS